MLLVWRKYIDDTVDGVRRTDRMQCGKEQMSGFGSRHCHMDRLIITHFAQKNHIRTLAQSSAQGGDIAVGIHMDLTLADDTFVVPVKKFQRVFQCDNVFFLRLVDLVNDTGKCCRLTASGRTGDQRHPFAAKTEIDDRIRDSQHMIIR